jgi:hypothetical protein
MKYLIRIAIIALTASNAIAQNDFKQEYAQYDSLANRARLVCNGAITPLWVDSAKFCYETREAEGVIYFKVDLTQQTKIKCGKEDLPKPLARTRPERRDTILSPDGKWKAFILDHNLWIEEISDIKNKEKVKLSYDGTANNFYTNTIVWSPDSRKIAAFKRQDAPKRTIPLVESAPATQLQPILQTRDYYKPGDLIPIQRPALFDITNRTQIPIDSKPFEHQYALRFGKWMSDSKSFTFEFNQRGHQLYQLVSVDAETGKTFVVVDEKSPTFI